MNDFIKYLVTAAFLTCFPLISQSQDLIVKRNKEEPKVSIYEIDSLQIKYRIDDFLDSPLFTNNKSEVEKVIFQSGSVVYFESILTDNAKDKEINDTTITKIAPIERAELSSQVTDAPAPIEKVKKKRRASGGGFGIKGGLNYNSNGNYFDEAQLIFGDPLNNLGFHAGFFGKIKFGPLFLRPELMYSQLKTELNGETLVTQRIDTPVLLGVGILRQFITVFAGPSFHYTISDELIQNAESSSLNLGYQAGFGINIGKLGIDLRYERVLSEMTIDFDQIIAGEEDFKSQQLILGLSIKF